MRQGIRGIRARTTVVGALLLVAAAALAPAAQADEAAALYDPGTVYVIHLTLPKTSEEKLEADPEGEYQPGEFSIAATTGAPGSEGAFSTPVKTEIRLKGSTSFESLAGKAAFKLKFKKGERPFGLKKMTLNNMVQDPSMVHETLSYEEFRATGVPAPRTGFADVLVNGHDYGIHLDLETVDEQALERMFSTPFDATSQHLYEGEDGTDVIPGDATSFEVDEGDETNIADLEALIAAVNGSGPEPWSTRVAPFAELTEMTRMWAVEKYVGQWDGYSGQIGAEQPNNYYLYDDTLGKFRMIPWGTDETFEADEHIAFDGQAGVLFDKCIEDEACLTTYWHSLTMALAAARQLDLPARAATLDALLAPWEEGEHGDGRDPYSRAEAHGAEVETAQYSTQRVGEAEAWLAAHEPPPETGGGGETGGGSEPGGGGSGTGGGSSGTSSSGGSTGSTGSSTSTPPFATPPGAPRLRNLRASDTALRTELILVAPETVGQSATSYIHGERHTACIVPAGPRPAGHATLECRLSPAARAVLRIRPLRLYIVTIVHGEGGTTSVFKRRITLAPR
jgi:CotH kinase protein